MIYDSLAAFYCGQQWRTLRKQLIDQQRKKDPQRLLRCALTGRIITNESEAIAHHIIELTLANVNDPSVALNPKNIIIVHHQTHNEIHGRFGYEAGRKVYYIYGAPCSGKNTFVRSVKGNSDLVVDIDAIWQSVTGGAKYEKPDALKAVVFRTRETLLDAVKTRTGKWQRAYIIEGGRTIRDREKAVREYGAELIHIEATQEECLQRLAADKERAHVRDKWAEYITQWFEEYQEGEVAL